MTTARKCTQLWDVLPLVVQHCASIHTVRDMCSLLQVSSSCRQQLQQSRADCTLAIALDRRARHQTGQQQDSKFVDLCQLLLSRGRWLPHHAGLVSALVMRTYHNGFSEKEQQVLQQILTAVLRGCRLPTSQQWPACTAAAAVAAAEPVAVATAGTAHTVPFSSVAAAPQLQLRRVDCDCLLGPVLLQVLAATGLQELAIDLDCCDIRFDTLSAAFCSGLSCITSLRDLQLYSTENAFSMGGLWPAIQHLTGLTCLVGVQLDPTVAQQLPRGLQELVVTVAFPADSVDEERRRSGCTVDLRHLTGLTCLQWEAKPEPLSACLPAQLQVLDVRGGLQSFSGGTGLQRVELSSRGPQDLGVLRSLSSLCRPWRLGFSHSCGHDDDDDVDSDVTADALQLAAATLGTATALTGLSLHVFCNEVHAQSQAYVAAFAAVKWCQHLVKLPSLRELSLTTPLARDDLLHLAALTGLRWLSCSEQECLESKHCGLDDFAASSLATALTGLTWLGLSRDNINSVGLLPVLAMLTGLQVLCVSGGPGFQVQEAERMTLSRLTQLTSLHLEGSDP